MPSGDAAVDFSSVGLRECAAIIGEVAALNAEGLHLDTDELCFDLLIAYFLPTIPPQSRRKLSKSLFVYRLIVDALNKNYLVAPHQLTNQLSIDCGLVPITASEYARINATYRELGTQTLFEAYLRSTERVFYRDLLLKSISEQDGFVVTNEQLAAVRRTSALLLFDDDLFDFDGDANVGKQSILIQYLTGRDATLVEAIAAFKESWRISCQGSWVSPSLKQFNESIFDLYDLSDDSGHKTRL